MTNEAVVSSVEGNRQWLDGGAMFGNVPRPVWEKLCPPDEQSRIELACRALLIEVDGKRILCETGIGAFFEPKLAARFGVTERTHVLLSSLDKLNLSDADIDAVVLSHLHFDHAGGLLPAFEEIAKGQDRLLFPRALYFVGSEAWRRATHPHPRDRASFIPGLAEKLMASGRLRIVDGATHKDLFPERLSFFYTDGHTPGQMHTVFRGAHRTVCFAGDLVPGRAWIHLPITMGYDRYPERVIDEKLALYEQAAKEDWWMFFTHDREVAASRLARGNGERWVASDEQTSWTRFSL